MMETIKGKVLVVEDESELRALIEDELGQSGLDVAGVSNGLQAIEHLRFHSVDCILSDLCMPKLSGMQLLQILRANGFYKPYIVLSAFGSRDDALELLRWGAMDFLENPMCMKRLAEVVKDAVQLGQALPGLRDEFVKQLGLSEDEMNPAFEKAIVHMAQLRFLRRSKIS